MLALCQSEHAHGSGLEVQAACAKQTTDFAGWCGCFVMAAAGGEGSSSANSSGSSKAVLSSWDSLASTLPADISSQPEMLQGGSLREYQMQVRRPVLQF
jgi:hypothetical protein